MSVRRPGVGVGVVGVVGTGVIVGLPVVACVPVVLRMVSERTPP
ncbi:hypothetical protein [uncultured Brevundimonas sp.]|nr:hypothetical protein [uncultured Brevundimonas sp.]